MPKIKLSREEGDSCFTHDNIIVRVQSMPLVYL